MKKRQHTIRETATRAALTAVAFASLCHVSCTSTPTQNGAVTGGLIGAVVGGVAGDNGGDVAAGAAIGAIGGAVAGRVYENQQERQRYDPYIHGGDNAQVEPLGPRPHTQPQPQPPQTYPDRQPYPQPQHQPQSQAQPQPEPVYPWARKADRSGHAISPHPPHNLINVEGFDSGELAIDPTTEKVFRVP